jgi:hypothetical protein
VSAWSAGPPCPFESQTGCDRGPRALNPPRRIQSPIIGIGTIPVVFVTPKQGTPALGGGPSFRRPQWRCRPSPVASLVSAEHPSTKQRLVGLKTHWRSWALHATKKGGRPARSKCPHLEGRAYLQRRTVLISGIRTFPGSPACRGAKELCGAGTVDRATGTGQECRRPSRSRPPRRRSSPARLPP